MPEKDLKAVLSELTKKAEAGKELTVDDIQTLMAAKPELFRTARKSGPVFGHTCDSFC